MADGDDDDDEGDDDGDDGEEGDEGDEEDGEIGDSEKGTPALQDGNVDQDMQNSPSADPPVTTAPADTPDAMDMTVDEPVAAAFSVQPLTVLPPTQPPAHITSPPFEGSPLRNVLVPFSPTEEVVPSLPGSQAAPALDSTGTEAQEATASEAPAHEAVAPEPRLDVPSDPIPTPVASVEALEALAVPEASGEVEAAEASGAGEAPEPTVAPEAPRAPTETTEEPTIAEPEVSIDTEMVDVASPQPETIVESNVVSAIDTEVGTTIIEEVAETVKAPLVDEPPPSEPHVVEAVTTLSEAVPLEITTESEKVLSPVTERPVSPVQESTPSATIEQHGQHEQSEQPVPSPFTQMTEVTELSAAPVVEVPLEVPVEVAAAVEEPEALTLPALNPLQTGISTASPLVEEREPESPDLLGGLEAALGQHSESRNEQEPKDEPIAAPSADTTEAPAAAEASLPGPIFESQPDGAAE